MTHYLSIHHRQVQNREERRHWRSAPACHTEHIGKRHFVVVVVAAAAASVDVMLLLRCVIRLKTANMFFKTTQR